MTKAAASTALQQATQQGLAAIGTGSEFTQLAAELGVALGAHLSYSGNTGVYQFKGQTIEHGTALIFNMLTMKKGFICWVGGKPVEQKMVGLLSGERMPVKAELTDHTPPQGYKQGEGWAEQIGVQVINPNDGTVMELNLSNKSGVAALSQLANAYGTKRKFNLDDRGVPKFPLVEISARGFQPKQAPGTKYAPELKIVDWVAEEEMQHYISANSFEEGEAEQTYVEPAGGEQVVLQQEVLPPQQAAPPAPPAPPAPVWDAGSGTWLQPAWNGQQWQFPQPAAPQWDNNPPAQPQQAPAGQQHYQNLQQAPQAAPAPQGNVQQAAPPGAPMQRPRATPTGPGPKPQPNSSGVAPGNRRPG